MFCFTEEKLDDLKPGSIPVTFFNTLSRKKEVFIPRDQRAVGMYNCGPTVYDFAQIGNLRSYVFSDLIRRTLEYNGYVVKQVINITDVGHLTGDNEGDPNEGDDKMTKALIREGKPLTLEAMKEVAETYTEAFEKDIKLLNIQKPAELPRASEHVYEQIAYIKTLDEKGYSYKLSDGIYFDTACFSQYGALSKGGRVADEVHSRVGVQDGKKSPADFALWKFNEELGWESPWGQGFPGWHIECSAMSTKYLGKQFDIHTGGIDHIDIHHNNEIAQTEAATGKKFVNVWMHNAFITIDGKKISKSLGNSITLRNVTDRGFSPLAYRYWLLTGHYRSQMNFTWEAIEGAQSTLFRLHRYFVEKLGTKTSEPDPSYVSRFHAFVNDDLNTPQAIALMHELVKDDSVRKEVKRATILDFDKILGLGFIKSNKELLENLSGVHKVSVQNIPEEIQKLIDKREKARREKDFEKADEIRDQIDEKGYTIKDTDSGPQLTEQKENSPD